MRWLVTRRGPNGEAYPTNVSLWLGYPTHYERIVGVLRERCANNPGWTLDSTDADEQHRRMVIARRRYDAAEQRWLRGRIGRLDPLHPDRVYEHPGNPSDWMPPAS